VQQQAPDQVYFAYVLGDLIKQVTSKVNELHQMEISYLAKGLTNLHIYIRKDQKLVEIEESLRKTLISRLYSDHLLLSSFEPYSVSKVLRYLLKFNTQTNHETVEVLKSTALHLVQTIKHRETSLQHSDLKDPLIDLEPHDIVDIVRIYGVIAATGTKSKSFAPPLFQNENEELDVLTSLDLSDFKKNVAAMGQEVLKALQPSIILKIESSSVSNIADILFSYSSASPALLDSKELNFVGKLEKAVLDKISSKDYFNTLSSVKILWALSNHYNKIRAPTHDVCDVLIQRTDLAKAKGVVH